MKGIPPIVNSRAKYNTGSEAKYVEDESMMHRSAYVLNSVITRSRDD